MSKKVSTRWGGKQIPFDPEGGRISVWVLDSGFMIGDILRAYVKALIGCGYPAAFQLFHVTRLSGRLCAVSARSPAPLPLPCPVRDSRVERKLGGFPGKGG